MLGQLLSFQSRRKYLISSGASAGLAAAFNAPLAGVLFSLEEVQALFTLVLDFSHMSAH